MCLVFEYQAVGTLWRPDIKIRVQGEINNIIIKTFGRINIASVKGLKLNSGREEGDSSNSLY